MSASDVLAAMKLQGIRDFLPHIASHLLQKSPSQEIMDSVESMFTQVGHMTNTTEHSGLVEHLQTQLEQLGDAAPETVSKTLLMSLMMISVLLKVENSHNQQLIKQGKHAYRSFHSCSPEFIRNNRPYMEKLGFWKNTTFYGPERQPPLGNCKRAQVLQSVPFIQSDIPKTFANFLIDRDLLRTHLAMSYIYDGAVSKWSANTAGVEQEERVELCGAPLCDAPEDSIPLQNIEDRMGRAWNLLVREYHREQFSVDICISVHDNLGDGRVVYQTEDSEGEPFDCQLMYEAEQQALKKFKIKLLWKPFYHDCVNFVEKEVEIYEKLKHQRQIHRRRRALQPALEED